jgi:6-pyruvoyltetrahydropterin/6-carboxytetrahydropterin synthase
MYTLGVQRKFSAVHYLIGGDWGAENQPHTHDYVLEVRLEAKSLDQHGYCVDIVQVDAALDAFVAAHAGATLNHLPAFAGLNPSIEHFARIAAHTFADALQAPNLTAVTVRIWENDIAWAEYRHALPAA